MTDFVTLTDEKTRERFDRNQERAIRNEGHGATPVSLKITEECIPILSSYIEERLKDILGTLSDLKLMRGRGTELRTYLRQLQNLEPHTIALCTLSAMLQALGRGHDLRKLCIQLGGDISGELWAKGLLAKDEKTYNRIERAVRKKHANVKHRKQAARSIAARAGFHAPRWSKEAMLKAGGVLAVWALRALPDVFYTHEGKRQRLWVHVREEALDKAIAAVSATVAAHPVHFPCVDPPLPWTGLHRGGYPDERLKGRVTLLRNQSKIQAAEARDAIKSGQMQPTLDAINALQAVPYTINRKVLAVMLQCIRKKIAVPGLPRPSAYPKPAHPKPWLKMTEDEQRAWRRRADKIEEKNRGLISDRMLFASDVETARLLAKRERFYTPFNADWRGRVYPMSHFNFQRDDRVRGLFLFADGQPIGDDGLKWLKVHVANTGDFEKISKRPIEERIAWVDKNFDLLRQCAENPFGNVEFWMKADKPFLFLAACMELIPATASSSYLTKLPISFDGSCSGLQHLAAMTRDEETAKLVNLVPNETPQDVYQRVADAVTLRVQQQAAGTGEQCEIAQRCLNYGITRTLVKRATMTFAYSSKKFGMAQQFKEDLMRPLETEVLAGDRDEHPFGDDNGREAAKYLASHVYDAITEIVTKPAQAMGFLQSLARAAAHESKPLRWTTPTGLPWVNAYYEPNYIRVKLWLHDSAVTLRVADGNKKEIDKNKAANGVAPNFVHACDAAHLMLTVNRCVEHGITNIATVHDSFGCLAPQAARFNEIIREQFVRMYNDHDVLAEVLAQSKCDLTQHNWHRLPEVVDRGSLNITEVRNATFAFA